MPEVVCRYCGVTGEVEILGNRGRKLKVIDKIDHEVSCKMYRTQVADQPKHLAKRRWDRQERGAGRRVGGRLTPASGALGEDGDLRSFHQLRVECKQTSSDRYTLDRHIWTKLVSGARKADEIPVLEVELLEAHGVWRIYVIPEGALDIEAKPHTPKGARTRLRLERGVEEHCPFIAEILDPPPVVLTLQQLRKALNDAHIFPSE